MAEINNKPRKPFSDFGRSKSQRSRRSSVAENRESVGPDDIKNDRTQRPQRGRVWKVKNTGGRELQAALIGDLARLQGENDALKEINLELKEPNMPCPPPGPVPDTPGAKSTEPTRTDATWVGTATVATTTPRLGTVTKAKCLKMTFEDLVKGHFAAFGYNEASHKSARTQAMRWMNIASDDVTVDECVAMIDKLWSTRSYMVSLRTIITGWVNDWMRSLVLNKWTWIIGGALTCTGIYFMGSKRYWLGLGAGLMIMPKRRDNLRVQKVPYITDFCTRHPINGVEIDTDATVQVPTYHRLECQPKRLPVGFSFGIDYLYVPRFCHHNEWNALVTRQLQPRIETSVKGRIALREAVGFLKQKIPFVPVPYTKSESTEMFLAKMPVGRRNAVRHAMNNTLMVDTRVAGFPKIEVMVGKAVGNRRVRFISGFDDSYLAETGPEYYIWQKCLIKMLWEKRVANDHTVPIFYSGGRTPVEVGNWFRDHCAMGWTILLLDVEKFDSRMKRDLLGCLFDFYKIHFGYELWQYLFATLDKEGKTKFGYVFSVIATVASGKVDTSMGNSLLVSLILYALLWMLERDLTTKYQSMILGDDSNVAVPHCNFDMPQLQSAALDLGISVSGEIIRPHEYHRLNYCSQAVVPAGENWVMAPLLGRLLTKTFVCHKYVPPQHMLEHIAGVLVGYQHYLWMPVLRSVYRRFFERHPSVVPKRFYDDRNPHKCVLGSPVEVDASQVEAWFYARYGFPSHLLEEVIMTMDFDIGDCYSHPLIDNLLQVDSVKYEYNIADYANRASVVGMPGLLNRAFELIERVFY